MDPVIWLQQNIEQILIFAASIIATASAIAAITPTPVDDGLLAKVYAIIDILALNIGKAKDTGDETPNVENKSDSVD